MLKTIASILSVALCAAQAQDVLKGLGRAPSEYTAVWGRAQRSGEGPFDTREQTWTVHRGGGFSGQDFEVHVLFRNERSVEERWVRPGRDPWAKEELWAVLDGKGGRFDMLRQGTPLTFPYQVLQTPNTLINFLPPGAAVLAQLQNTLQGPQILFSSREWAQAKVDLGLTGKRDEGRLASQAVQNRRRPQWGGRSLSSLTSGLKDLGTKNGARTYLPRGGKGTLSVSSRKGTRLELFIPDALASGDPNRILRNNPATAPLRGALRDQFRRFYNQANYAVPGLLGGNEWSADQVEGAFTDDVLQDLIALKQLPSEFPLLSWKDGASGEAWDLVITAEGFRLSIQWPSGIEPR
jgi:hypothetical protein